jgi:hypothetical protein
MQFIGPEDSEPLLFALSRVIEKAAGVAGRRPPGAVA